MLQSFVIALREGVEAALVIAIAVAYLRKIGRDNLLSSVYKALGAAVFASFLVAAVLSRLEINDDRYEGPLLLLSAVFVLSMVLWMNRHARRLSSEIETGLQQRASSEASRWGIFLFVFLMVFREGVETVLMLSGLRFNTSGVMQSLGTAMGLALAVLFGVSFVRGTVRINLGSFFRMTTAILMVVVLQLTITGLHELSEGQIIWSSPKEMALVGPIVRNEVFFFVMILALAATMLLMEWRNRRAPEMANLEGAALRKVKWTAKRERSWMVASCSAAALFILAITAEFLYAKSATELSPAATLVVSGGVATIPVSAVSDGMLHRFAVESDGVAVRIIAIRRPDQSIAIAFDACQICGHQGYYQDGRNVICKNCASAINIPTIGQTGGCNPIPIESKVEGGQILISAEKLLAGSRIFRAGAADLFLRFVGQSIRRSPGRKMMAIGAVALGSAVATAVLGAMLDIGDRVNRELRSLGANLLVTPKSASLPVEIGGIRYQPASKNEFIPVSSVSKIKSIFWQLNITALAPSLRAQTTLDGREVPVEGVWFQRDLRAPDGTHSEAGLRRLNTAWKVQGRWIDDRLPNDRTHECMLGAALARRLGLQPGSVLDLFGEPFSVAGIVATGGDEEDRVFVPLEVLERLTGRAGQVDAIEVAALTKPEDAFARKDPSKMRPEEYERWNCTPYVSSIAFQIEQVLPMAVARPIRRVADNEGRVLNKVRGLMLLIALAALATAALTVWSVMATTVLERRYEIAIMEATGAGSGLIVALLGAEVALQGAVGGLIGALVGMRLAGAVSQTVFGVHGAAPAFLLPLVVLVSTVVALAGAARPLRNALTLEPAVLLREGT